MDLKLEFFYSRFYQRFRHQTIVLKSTLFASRYTSFRFSPDRETRAWTCQKFRSLRKLALRRHGERESAHAVIDNSASTPGTSYAAFREAASGVPAPVVVGR